MKNEKLKMINDCRIIYPGPKGSKEHPNMPVLPKAPFRAGGNF
jgi:hypothetical protein